MSESVKPRFAVDLNEIERQLAHSQAASAQANSSTRNDPLAELARIVGQDDPFGSLLSQDRQGRSQAADPFADMFQQASQPQAQAPRAPTQELRGHEHQAYDLDQYQQPAAHAYQAPQAYAQQGHDQQGYDDQNDYDPNYYGDPNADLSAYGDDQDVRSLEPRRSRKGLMTVGALVAAAVIGTGAAWYATGSSALISGGEPPLVKASAEPTKVQPENPGGVEIPNQNKQIYERAKQTTETKVVNREEQPVDVNEAARQAAAGSPDATGATASAPTAAASLNLGEPKKVRTVTIRPEGASPAPAQQAPVAAPAAMTLPTAAQPAQQPRVQVADASAQATQPTRPVPVTPASPVIKPVAATPAATPQPQRVAAVQPVAPVAAETEAAQVAAAPTGGFAVQLGVSNSEAAAQTAFRNFQKKYADLEGLSPVIRKADVNGNAIYRVRVGPMSRDDASSLCSKLQGEGGQCFVAKN